MTKQLTAKARQIRRQTFEMIVNARKGHVGGSLSDTDLLVALYNGILRHDPANPLWPDRDRYIHSKGHAPESFYAVLADAGYFDPKELDSYAKPGALLGPSADTDIPGVEIHGGSLGHGLGIAAGMALAAKLDYQDYAVVALLGDGESHEGSVWEAGMFAARHKLKNLVMLLDHNHQMVLDYTISLDPVEKKWEAFGWEVRVIDGHDFLAIQKAFSDIHDRRTYKPLAIIAETTKGKGISYMEGQIGWHHGVPNEAQIAIARKELA